MLGATTADYSTCEHTHFKERAKQMAAEIARNQPDLVGLQEVATWHRGTFNPLDPFALPEPVSEDFTKELLAAIAADRVRYEVVSRHDNNFTLAFPIVVNAEPFPKNLEAVGMVESGEILARSDLPPGQLKLSHPHRGVYKHKVEFENPYTHEEIPFTNGWQSIDAKVRGKSFRFITTHLDALAPGGLISGPQAAELMAGPIAGTSLPVILAGDMNSGLTDSPAAYETFVKGGLTDTWTAAGLGPPPLTCCHLGKEDLVNEPSSVYTEDLDHVFTRGGLSVLNEHLVGNTVPHPPPVPFIWPSDHAGMVATLAVAP